MTIAISIDDELYKKIKEYYPENKCLGEATEIYKLMGEINDGIEVDVDAGGVFYPIINTNDLEKTDERH
jgi:hypothetical protein